MKEFKDKVLVVTGAGSGIGAAIAVEGAARGMKIVINDIDAQGVDRTAKTIREMGGEVVVQVGDASLAEEVKGLFDLTIKSFQRADILVNNAGVSVSGPIWEVPIQDIQWITEANFLGHAYGMHYFIPQMIRQGSECAVINVASAAGITISPQSVLYHATKAADVSLSEGALLSLKNRGINNIQVHCLCPAFIKTTIHLSELHRPQRYQDRSDPYYQSDEFVAGTIRAKRGVMSGIEIDSVGMTVFGALEDNNFYIFTHPEAPIGSLQRAANMAKGNNPV